LEDSVMKTVASMACIFGVGLIACASGATGGGLYGEGETTDSGSPVIVVGDSGVPVVVEPTSSAGTTPGKINGAADSGSGGGLDAGGPSAEDDDAGSDGFSDDAGSEGFGYDAGADDFGYDAGYGYGDDAGSGSGSTCDGYADPNTPSTCYCEASDPSECQPNGCYGGYYCDTYSDKCKESAPSGC
jgi:hypothetical protein